jgi:hypothetical protein
VGVFDSESFLFSFFLFFLLPGAFDFPYFLKIFFFPSREKSILYFQPQKKKEFNDVSTPKKHQKNEFSSVKSPPNDQKSDKKIGEKMELSPQQRGMKCPHV